VLLLGSQEKTSVGLPYVNGGEVDVMVEENTRDKKAIIFNKKKRRKNYRRKNGFKREVTFLRILDIRFP
jgi:large subunit ribosomal protein L21